MIKDISICRLDQTLMSQHEIHRKDNETVKSAAQKLLPLSSGSESNYTDTINTPTTPWLHHTQKLELQFEKNYNIFY